MPLGHHLIVHKMVPFGALFWCHFPKGHYFVLVPLFVEKDTVFSKWCPRSTVLVPFFL